MCGIGGTAGLPPDPELLERMAATMHKRGPDGQRTWHDARVGFAFRRLAIIDLHERSSQPQHLGPLHLIFNGELYNYREVREELRGLGHRFATEGDAEVLLHAWAEWGDAALDRANGMFALAVWDDAERRLTLASDPFGEKPVYYAHAGGGLVWASELKALLLHGGVRRRADDEAVAAYLARGAMPAIGSSFFEGISRLPAAHLLEWQDGTVRVRRYWRPRRVDAPARPGEAASALRELLLDSIRLRLRSDVPVGTSLSGGVDSSTVVLLSAQLAGEHTRHAFTARFPGFERDEWRYAAAVAQAAGVAEHHAVEPTAASLLHDLDELVRDHEEPVGSLSIYAQWCVNRAARDAGVTVLLDGQGGDELFGGYPATAAYAVRALPWRAAARELRRDGRLLPGLGASLAADYLPEPLRRLARARTAAPYASAAAREASARIGPVAVGVWREEPDPLRRQLLVQSFDSSLPHLLRYADRSSMAWSREVRLPLLDRRLADLALSLPAELLYREGVSKRVLRDAGRGLVPEEVLVRRDKVGFEPPQRRWLAEEPLRSYVADVLLDPRARARALYDAGAIERDFRQGAWRDPAGIWWALNLELWLRALVEQVPGAAEAAPAPAAVG
ncbi:MAG: asparagine synthase (glutamine-hydrolyzing) [Thermoleophilia bacterium]|nr:asparagine synthase (glutamine-hydrolyzing) [Thermoleophilia bacterium]